MQDVMSFFAKTIVSSTKRNAYFTEPLEDIATENADYAYVDNRKDYSDKLIKFFQEKILSDKFIQSFVFISHPTKLKPLIQIFPPEFLNLRWDDVLTKAQSLNVAQHTKLMQRVRSQLIKVLKSKDLKIKNELLSVLLGFTFLSKSDNFPDFMFPVSIQEEQLNDGSLFELKDSKGGSISSFNSTLPTQWKSLQEITRLNGSDGVSKLARIIDYPLSMRDTYNTFKRRCFYFIRTNSQSEKVRVSVVEGSFFETLPKEYLIGETIKAIARDHFGGELTPELEQMFERINDQSLIAKSRSDLKSTIKGIEKKASISPRFRIMSEVTSDGNPHYYQEVQVKTFNLILQVSPTRERDNKYREKREELISMMNDSLSQSTSTKITYRQENEREVLESKHLNVDIKEIAHNRNGLHLVFQYKFGEKN